MKLYKIAVSSNGYDAKLPRLTNEWQKMIMRSMYLTKEEIINYIGNGYYFCQPTNKDIFNLSYKKTENIDVISYIPIDIDDNNEVSYLEMVNRLKGYTNIIVYPTFSYNEKEKDYKLRILFLLDKPIFKKDMTTKEFDNLYKVIYEQVLQQLRDVLKDLITDNNMTKIAQGMWGTNSTCVFSPCGNITINITLDNCFNNSFNNYNIIDNVKDKDNNKGVNQNLIQSYTTTHTPTYSRIKQELVNPTKEQIEFINTPLKEYVNGLKDKYKIIDNNLESIPNNIAAIPIEEYIDVYENVYYDKSKNQYFIKLIRDKHKRRNTIYSVATKIRLIKRDIEFEELLFNVANWFTMCVDNTKDAITNYDIFKQCKSAFETDVDELYNKYIEYRRKLKEEGKLLYKTKRNPYYIKPKKEKKKGKWDDKIKEMYNPNLSANKNAKEIGCALHYIQDYIKELKKNKEREDAYNEIDKVLFG